MRPLTIKLPKHLDEKLDRMARQYRVSRAEIVRRALGVYVTKPSLSALDVLGDFVGAFKGGPRDLSTNPKHLEGFGAYRPPRRRYSRRSA